MVPVNETTGFVKVDGSKADEDLIVFIDFSFLVVFNRLFS